MSMRVSVPAPSGRLVLNKNPNIPNFKMRRRAKCVPLDGATFKYTCNARSSRRSGRGSRRCGGKARTAHKRKIAPKLSVSVQPSVYYTCGNKYNYLCDSYFLSVIS